MIIWKQPSRAWAQNHGTAHLPVAAAGPEAHRMLHQSPAPSQNLPLPPAAVHSLKTINGFLDTAESSFRIILWHYFELQNVEIHFRQRRILRQVLTRNKGLKWDFFNSPNKTEGLGNKDFQQMKMKLNALQETKSNRVNNTPHLWVASFCKGNFRAIRSECQFYY